jgi:phosphoribosylanthranilate isomerase
VKICGITSVMDAEAAVAAGADAIGLVFYPRSPRAVSVEQASAIAATIPPFVTTVALFVDAGREAVNRVLASVPVGLLQFHGSEDPAYCAGFQRPWIKSVAMRAGVDLAGAARHYSAARGLLLDAWEEGIPGGTGKTFDWDQARSLPGHMPLVLAGGLNPDNVGAAIARVRPLAVDVSSGVEQAPGRKDKSRIAQFMAAVRDAERGLQGVIDEQ